VESGILIWNATLWTMFKYKVRVRVRERVSARVTFYDNIPPFALCLYLPI